MLTLMSYLINNCCLQVINFGTAVESKISRPRIINCVAIHWQQLQHKQFNITSSYCTDLLVKTSASFKQFQPIFQGVDVTATLNYHKAFTSWGWCHCQTQISESISQGWYHCHTQLSQSIYFMGLMSLPNSNIRKHFTRLIPLPHSIITKCFTTCHCHNECFVIII